MNESYDRGIAFIFEGATEKVFYRSLLKWIARKNGCTFEKIVSEKDADLYYIWTHRSSKILIKVNTVGAITQITNTGKWFINTCAKKHKVPWRVYLCYDTDNAQNDITKFYEGDWKLLRTDLKKTNAEEIDLVASADIEDIMLYDIDSICSFLVIKVPGKIPGRKGKAKMKWLFRSCGSTYHEGEKAENMISSLDFQKLINRCPLKLKTLKEDLLNELHF